MGFHQIHSKFIINVSRKNLLTVNIILIYFLFFTQSHFINNKLINKTRLIKQIKNGIFGIVKIVKKGKPDRI